jgi:hypothetical protein
MDVSSWMGVWMRRGQERNRSRPIGRATQSKLGFHEGIPDKQCSGRTTTRKCHARGSSTAAKTVVSRVLLH